MNLDFSMLNRISLRTDGEAPIEFEENKQNIDQLLQTSQTEAIMHNILSGAREAENTRTLLLQAVEVISLLVRDGGAFEKSVKENLEFVADEALEAAHKAGLDYFTEPKKSELIAIDHRIQRLKSELETASEKDKTRKQHAIERHEQLKELYSNPQL